MCYRKIKSGYATTTMTSPEDFRTALQMELSRRRSRAMGWYKRRSEVSFICLTTVARTLKTPDRSSGLAEADACQVIAKEGKNAPPIQIRLKEGKQPVRIKQYPLRREDREGISPIIENFLQLGLLKECQSDFNTPILPVRKPDGTYRIVQDLQAVNKITEDLYPVVANPYTLLTCLTPELTWFTVLDLKDAFFCLPLHETSQKIFAFEWQNPKSGRKTQLTWTVLPQGFKNSPTLFGEQLAKDLESWEAPPGEGKMLQYVDDILIATPTEEGCVAWTVSLLNFLGLQGYRVSKKKAQVVKQKVIYLGYEISAGQRTLGKERIESICQTPKPQTIKELRTFLGMTGWCRLWIYNYGLLVKPLYSLIANGSRDLQWTKETTQAFGQLKKALMSAPALGLPDVSKPFFLFSHEKQGIALGILAQDLGPYRRAVAYLSKQLDAAAKGWPGCLRAVAAVVLNIQEARKFTLGQKMTVLVSHTVSSYKGLLFAPGVFALPRDTMDWIAAPPPSPATVSAAGTLLRTKPVFPPAASASVGQSSGQSGGSRGSGGLDAGSETNRLDVLSSTGLPAVAGGESQSGVAADESASGGAAARAAALCGRSPPAASGAGGAVSPTPWHAASPSGAGGAAAAASLGAGGRSGGCDNSAGPGVDSGGRLGAGNSAGPGVGGRGGGGGVVSLRSGAGDRGGFSRLRLRQRQRRRRRARSERSADSCGKGTPAAWKADDVTGTSLKARRAKVSGQSLQATGEQPQPQSDPRKAPGLGSSAEAAVTVRVHQMSP
ncbi:uncharacterized protein [Anomalospiza imberbis]|uniref:uncharacterized protein n=1 Tax=Anomalospiza imberbis TaxID=187417 RepID=UPI00358E8EDF